MAIDIPVPKVIADVGPGGGLVTAMGGMNALSNAMLDTKINQAKAAYAPWTEYADAASKIAYSKLVGPQFLAKLMGHENILANSPELQDPNTTKTLYQAGMGGVGGGGGNNALALLPVPGTMSAPGSSSNPSLLGWVVDKIKNALSPNYNQPAIPEQNRQGVNVSPPSQPYTTQDNNNSGYSYDKNGNNIKGTKQDVEDAIDRSAPQSSSVPAASVPIAPSVAAPSPSDAYANNVAHYKGLIKEGETLGTKRGDAISDIGKQQLDLSNSGTILDHMTGIIQNPVFQNMRNQIPYYQDKQLWYLSKNGTPEQQKLIGDFISTAQAFKASTVNSFKGKVLEKEFNLADKIKIDENDTLGVAQGKLSALRTLKEIAETKNDVILGLMRDKHLDLGEAVKQANKLVNTKYIEEQVNNLLNPQPSEQDIQYMMKKRNMPRDKIITLLKQKGFKNVT